MRDVRFQHNRKILEMKPESFSGILKERLLLPVLVEPADECDVRLQLNRKRYSKIMSLPLISTLTMPLCLRIVLPPPYYPAAALPQIIHEEVKDKLSRTKRSDARC